MVHSSCRMKVLAGKLTMLRRLTCIIDRAISRRGRVRLGPHLWSRRCDCCCCSAAFAFCSKHLHYAAVGGVLHVLESAMEQLDGHGIPARVQLYERRPRKLMLLFTSRMQQRNSPVLPLPRRCRRSRVSLNFNRSSAGKSREKEGKGPVNYFVRALYRGGCSKHINKR